MGFKIELKEASYGYEGGGELLRGIDFAVRPGEVLGVVAPVGGGKSTFLKLAAGLLRPRSGRLIVDGADFWGMGVKENYRLRSRMGFDFQEAALVVNMTIFQNLALPLRYHGAMGEGEIGRLVDGWLARMELSSFRDSLPAALSSGLKRRVSFIRTVITPREFYFWDEPTQGANTAFIEAVVASIGEAKKRGASSIFATQNAPFLGRVADRVLVLSGGRIAYMGPLESGRIPVAIASEGMLRE